VNRLFCFGLGYTGQALARSLMADGWRVAGTCRGEAQAADLAGLGVEIHQFDRPSPLDGAAEVLAGTTHLLSSVPPDADGDAVLDLHAREIADLAPQISWAGYLSTTGVYGTRDGGWVDETSERRPGSPRSSRRVAAEDAWLKLGEESGLPVHLFRLAGIYGPGRSALDQVRAGTAKRVDRAGQVFSRIHVDDIVTVLRASMAKPNPDAAYNVCDDQAAPPADVIAYACDLLGVEPPPLVPFEEADLSDMAKTFWNDNKRVRNNRLHDELGVELAYPNYHLGLKAIYSQAQTAPPASSGRG